MNNKPTIVAFVLFFLSLTLAFFITASDNKKDKDNNDIEIFVVKQPVDIPNNVLQNNESLLVTIKTFITDSLKNYKSFLYNVIDSYEIEISDFWKEVLNHFEILEYYKSTPDAFIRRLIIMPTLTGRKEIEPVEIDSKPIIYPDYDYRSIKYRVSLVPDTIETMKSIVDYFFNRIKISLNIVIPATINYY